MQALRSAVDRMEEGILATLLAVMTILTFVQVVLRYLFNTGFVWSLEGTTYSFAALVLFGMSYGVRTRTHIAVDLVVRRLPKRAHKIVQGIAIAACLLYAALMLYGSAVFVDRLYALGHMARDVPLPKWLLTATMPVGFLLLAYRFAEAGWRLLRGTGDGAGATPPVAAVRPDSGDDDPEERR